MIPGIVWLSFNEAELAWVLAEWAIMPCPLPGSLQYPPAIMSQASPSTPRSDERRLAAIMFTDVVGYSARMQTDETGTRELVRADFAVMRELCGRMGGEVLNSMGDGLLLCFPSVVQAVSCGLLVQEQFSARPAPALQHRIGIHLGDVFRRDGQVDGDGVNIAARLQTKARPHTICLSQSVYDAVKGKLAMQVEPLGPQRFKNIAEPLNVYLAGPDGAAMPAAPGRGWSRNLWAVGLAIIVAGLAALFWPKSVPVTAGVAVPPAGPAPDKSIAVLPFTNMSEDKDNAFFADGVHEDLLTNLANLSAMKVISRTSVMQYRGTTKTIRQIGAELGVAYILEGSVRRAGDKVRVTGQLINALTDEHVWAKAYDRDLKDIFAVQAELAREIATALRTALTPTDSARLEVRPTKSLAAYDLFQQARAVRRRGKNVRDMREVVLPLLEQAVGLDPDYAEAWAEIADAHVMIYGLAERTDARLQLARQALAQAERLAPDAYAVLTVGANLGAITGDRDLVNARRQRIGELFAGRSEARVAAALTAAYEHRWADDRTELQAAVELDPRNPEVLGIYIGVLLNRRRFDEAGEKIKRLVEIQPENLLARNDQASVPFLRTGSSTALKQLAIQLAEDPAQADTNMIIARARVAYNLADWAQLIQLWRDTGPRFKFSDAGDRMDRLMVAGAFLELGDAGSARPLLEQNRDGLTKQLLTEPKNIAKWNDLGLTLGMLGDRPGATAALDRARAIIEANPRGQGALNGRWDNALARAWTEDAGQVVAELDRLLKGPDFVPYWSNVHGLRVSWMCRPLRGDPRFEAMLNDPRNNAPLP